MHDGRLDIGTLIFDDVDQLDVTGPFEVLSRIPNVSCHLFSPDGGPVRDVKGLRLVPDAAISDAPRLNVLHIPGGAGQEQIMTDQSVLEWVRSQCAGADAVLSVCTGALILGAAGALMGRTATTHWSAIGLLPLFGARVADERVVKDDKFIFTAGVTAGIDGALRLVADLRGQPAAERIQLDIAYAPEPPFNAGTPQSAPPAVREAATAAVKSLTNRREESARRVSDALSTERADASRLSDIRE